ncbi:HAD-IIIC family phosphatase [Polynucleobacter sp. MWH-Adler-W8]|uniref:HAD-IIIC family phosphatase n=1 Tax=Polynucleobacter sp. MWH-Adler-W8 TaxID=1819727 RepID=UPI00092CB2DA|nr:HAD-IIIC family phosphatase [Polynucleobacter sp. MWH-Adler-W8]OJI04682.1 hypothetical protein AOC28_06985 [Polynucleobacter sp. MWH-Adler-W8]
MTIENSMQHFDAQEILFAEHLSRLDLLKLDLSKEHGKKIVVNIWRTHGFEPLIPLMKPFFDFQGWHVDFNISGYDDTLMFEGRKDASLDIVWLDSIRALGQVDFREWVNWLAERIMNLRKRSSAPIILATWIEGVEQVKRLQALVDAVPGVYFANLLELQDEISGPFIDIRSEKLAGTPLGRVAQLEIARKLACHWMPAALSSSIKAVILDLDNTLHSGVLGEDGVDGVKLMPGHLAFQKYIKSLGEKGIFLALVSKNELADVKELFEKRDDYPLRLEDFSAVEVSWAPKSDAIKRVAKTLRIAPDAMLFVDDNPGELANVISGVTQIHTLYAHEDAFLTSRAVHNYPALWRWRLEEDDAKRILDLKANAERELLSENISDPSEYFRGLKVGLIYRYDPLEQLTRITDLCNKTNQFNLAIQRFNQVEIAERLKSKAASIATVQLTDRLSDSGVIAIIVASKKNTQLVVEELCISCRAMGRRLEDTIVLQALKGMSIIDGCTEVIFKVSHGPRNQPALDWLADLLSLAEGPPEGEVHLPISLVNVFKPIDGVKIEQGIMK